MSHPTQVGGPSPLVARLADGLADAEVVYCHWKSNTSIERAEMGLSDLDLLVARHHVREFIRVVSETGFVGAERVRAVRPLGITDFFGYDPATDRIVHLHAHYRLVLGHDLSKNHHLPIEEPYLASATRDGLLPTPAPEFEYIVLVIRMVLKYAVPDEILWNATRGKRPGKGSERDELIDLRSRIDRGLVSTILNAHLSWFEPRLFEAAETVVGGGVSPLRRMLVARKVEASLEAHGRHGPAADAVVRSWRRVVRAARRRTGTRSSYRLVSGGAFVAVMGGDGAGKSTALEGLAGWLEPYFDVMRVHLGKPGWSSTTYLVRGVLKMLKLVGVPVAADESESGRRSGQGDIRSMLWLACKSRDRYLAYRRAQRFANKGGIVVSDRFPHPSLRLMDVPQIDRLTKGGSRGWLVKRLIGIENLYHRRVVLPDVGIVLRLDPTEAARRKESEPYDYVVERSTEVWETEWDDSVVVIDAGRPPHEVLATIKSVVWSALA